ncbi:CxxH/CxxC protein [Bacillus coahuilensis]|uniref:CxxH/CxxC protein n=1 Tax=Bacillus coahuilensis TaxID=408580 RepID=UPI0001851422|nr:CxxH/CxxC protein [Bacillus coahuilensis]
MIYCCDEHVELALDVAVDEQEEKDVAQPPSLNKVDNSQNLSTTCEYCPKNATYIVAN